MLLVCATWDKSALAFTQPAYFQTQGLAVRAFGDAVNRREGENVLRAHPQDFSFYQLATYDDQTGEFANANVKLVDAVTVIVDE